LDGKIRRRRRKNHLRELAAEIKKAKDEAKADEKVLLKRQVHFRGRMLKG